MNRFSYDMCLEIFISYSDSKLTTAERQEALWNIFRFKCTCPLCTKPGQVIDQNKMKDLKGNLINSIIFKL